MLEILSRLDESGFYQLSDSVFSEFKIASSCKENFIFSEPAKKTLSCKHMKDGFEIRKELFNIGSNEIEMESVYNHHGHYIGDIETAKRLLKKNIIPEIVDETHSVCSIGYCPTSGEWFGWSHRAIRGFKIGDNASTLSPTSDKKSKEKIKSLEEAKKAAIEFAESVS
jgi:hypothetical protein